MDLSTESNLPLDFGKYRLLRRLARGGMAEIFLATSPDFPAPVVVKRVLPHFHDEADFLKMFLNEARIAAQLNHPGIVQILDLGETDGQLYLTMEHVDGFDLERLTRMAGGVLPPAICARIGADLCEVLHYANRVFDISGKPLRVVHRDVTPGNVMVCRDGTVKLVDFGVAKAEAQLEKTRPGVVKGKFRYMSPEQIDMKPLDGRSDLFSLGVLLYEISTGQKPFERAQIIETALAITGFEPASPELLVPHFPASISSVIMKALRKNRDERYSSGREMRRALEEGLRELGGTSNDDVARFIAGLSKDVAGIEEGALLESDLVEEGDETNREDERGGRSGSPRRYAAGQNQAIGKKLTPVESRRTTPLESFSLPSAAPSPNRTELSAKNGKKPSFKFGHRPRGETNGGAESPLVERNAALASAEDTGERKAETPSVADATELALPAISDRTIAASRPAVCPRSSSISRAPSSRKMGIEDGTLLLGEAPDERASREDTDLDFSRDESHTSASKSGRAAEHAGLTSVTTAGKGKVELLDRKSTGFVRVGDVRGPEKSGLRNGSSNGTKVGIRLENRAKTGTSIRQSAGSKNVVPRRYHLYFGLVCLAFLVLIFFLAWTLLKAPAVRRSATVPPAQILEQRH